MDRPGRLAVAERPGRGGRNHRRELRIAEQAVVARRRASRRSSRACAAATRWPSTPRTGSPSAGIRCATPSRRARSCRPPWPPCGSCWTPGDGAVLVHCDRANEWLAAIDAALRLGLGLARTPRAALRAAEADGLPVGSLAASIVGRRRASAAA